MKFLRGRIRGLFLCAIISSVALLTPHSEVARADLPDVVRLSECGAFSMPTELTNGNIVAIGDFTRKCDVLGSRKVSSFIVQFQADGHLRKSFGKGGFHHLGTNAYLGAPSNRGGLDLLPRPDGGFYSFGESRIEAFLPNGEKDRGFSESGLLPSYPGGPSGISAGSVQADGKLLLAQSIFRDGNSRYAVARYLPSGVIDSSFGDSGAGFTELPGSDQAFDSPTTVDHLVVADNGQIYGSTWLWEPMLRFAAVFRMSSNGEVDSTYGGAGTGVGLVRASDRYAGELQIHASQDGSITALVSQLENSRPFAARLDPEGQPLGDPFALQAEPLGIDSSNRVITGSKFGPDHQTSNFSIGRSFVGGTPDDKFGNGHGRFTGYFGPESSSGWSARENGEGGYFASGWVSECDGTICHPNAALVKLDSKGRLASGFGDLDGLVVIPRVRCPLGTPRTGKSTLVVRARCIAKGGEFDAKAKIDRGSGSPGLSFTTGPFARPEEDGSVGAIPPWTRRTVRIVLPKSVRFNPGRIEGRLFARLTSPFKTKGRNLELRRAGNTLIAGIDISSDEPVRPRLIVGVKPGAIRHLAPKQREKLAFRVKLRQSDGTFRTRVGSRRVIVSD